MAGERKVEAEITIDADAETVWQAISTGEGLKSWFTLDARVKPGVGGAVWMSFGEGADWESPIEIWKPGQQLRTVDEMPGQDGAPPTRIAVDYMIETRDGKTVLRLVHSGMAADTWEDELDTLNAGWRAFLIHLKHALERHPGERRVFAHFRHPAVALPRPEAFARTLRALGMPDPSSLQAGSRYTAALDGIEPWEGEVKLLKPAVNLTATVETLGDGMLIVEMEPGRGKCRPSVWVSLYGEEARKAESLQPRIRKILESEFADATAS